MAKVNTRIRYLGAFYISRLVIKNSICNGHSSDSVSKISIVLMIIKVVVVIIDFVFVVVLITYILSLSSNVWYC